MGSNQILLGNLELGSRIRVSQLWEAELKSDIKLRPELALCQDKAKCMLKLWGNQAAENSRKQVNRGRPMTKTKLPLRQAGKGQSLGGLTS